MTNFDKAIERVLKHEGGYVDNPKDPGGETNFGITRNTATAAGYKGSMRSMTRDQAKAIYRARYWAPIKGDDLPFAIAYQLLDAAVNHGVGQAVKFLQRSVGAQADELIGPATIAAVKAKPVGQVVNNFLAHRTEFFCNLPTFDTFGRGWIRRVAANMRYAASDV